MASQWAKGLRKRGLRGLGVGGLRSLGVEGLGVRLLLVLITSGVVLADVYWNPGDRIARHDSEFEEVAKVMEGQGIKISRVEAPARLEDEILYVRNRYGFPGSKERLDIFRTEASWLRAMEESLYDLNNIFTKEELSSFDPRALQAATVNGKLLALPSFLDFDLLYYRKDILEEYGYQGPPQTWDELEEMAHNIQTGEREKRCSGDACFWGLMWQGAPNEVLTKLVLSVLASHGAGTILDSEGSVDVNNPQAIRALERMQDWIGWITPPTVINQHLHETKVPFLLEEALFLIDLSHVMGEIHSWKPQGWQLFSCSDRLFGEKASYTHIPGSPGFGNRRTHPSVWGWSVNRHTPSLGEVREVLTYLGSEELQRFKAMRGDFPTLLTVQEGLESQVCQETEKPNVCTFPLKNMLLNQMNLETIGPSYFDLGDREDKLGFSPLVFNGMNEFLRNPNFTASELVKSWDCEITYLLQGSNSRCDPCPRSVTYAKVFPEKPNQTLIVVLGTIGAIAVGLAIYLRRKQLAAERLWRIQGKALIVADPIELLGEGLDGEVVKGFLNGTEVAVKRAFSSIDRTNSLPSRLGRLRRYSHDSEDRQSTIVLSQEPNMSICKQPITGSSTNSPRGDRSRSASPARSALVLGVVEGRGPSPARSLWGSQSPHGRELVEKAEAVGEQEIRSMPSAPPTHFRAEPPSNVKHPTALRDIDGDHGLEKSRNDVFKLSIADQADTSDPKEEGKTPEEKPPSLGVHAGKHLRRLLSKAGGSSEAGAAVSQLSQAREQLDFQTTIQEGVVEELHSAPVDLGHVEEGGPPGSHYSGVSGTSSSGISVSDVFCFRCYYAFKRRREVIKEVRKMAGIRHPCIVTVMGAVIDSLQPVVVMELMHCGSLYDLYTNDLVDFDGEIMHNILLDITAGMVFLHSSDPPIIHGSLKASNILVDERFRAKVSDFGMYSVRKQISDSQLRANRMWMAPELISGGKPSQESDVFAFAVTLCETISRRDPCDIMDLVENPRVGFHARPSLPDDSPQTLHNIVQQCFLADSEDRPTFKTIRGQLRAMNPTQYLILWPKKEKLDVHSQSVDTISSMFPKHVASALIKGDKVSEDIRECASVLFAEIPYLDKLAEQLEPEQLTDLKKRLDEKVRTLAKLHEVYLLDTIGDGFWVGVTNLVEAQYDDHVARMGRLGLGLLRAAKETLKVPREPMKGNVTVRVAFDCGPLVGNLVGTHDKRYTIHGATVNTASRMQHLSIPSNLVCTQRAAETLYQQDKGFQLRENGTMHIKGSGHISCGWQNNAGHRLGNSRSRPEISTLSLIYKVRLSYCTQDLGELDQVKHLLQTEVKL